MTDDPTVQALDRDLAAAGCDGALHVLDLETGHEIGLRADAPVVLASVFKLFVALEFHAAVVAGALDPTERIRVDPAASTAGPTGLSSFADPVEISLRDLCAQMMSVSDNAATDLLLARVGIDQVNARLHACGCHGSVVASGLGVMFDLMARDIGFPDYARLAAARDGALGPQALADANDRRRVDAAAAFDPLRTNRSTPRDMTRLLAAIWRDQAAPPAACAAVRAVMGGQVGGRFARALPDGASLASKTGSLTGRVRNEAGVITHADGRAFAVAVFTRAHAPFARVSAIETAIGQAAASAVAALRDRA